VSVAEPERRYLDAMIGSRRDEVQQATGNAQPYRPDRISSQSKDRASSRPLVFSTPIF
jgi:hypothetical protein